MKFLKKLLKRSSDEDEEDEDEDFGFDEDDDGPKTQVIMDEDDDQESAYQPSDDEEDVEEGNEPDELFGTGSEVGESDDDDDAAPVMGQDEYDVEVDGEENADAEDIEDLDFDDEELDFDDEDDDEEGEGSGRRPIVFIAAGVGVLLLGIIGGAAFWYLNNGADEDVAEATPLPDGAVQMVLPPRAGSLNALGDGDEVQATGNDTGTATDAPNSKEETKTVSDSSAAPNAAADAAPNGEASSSASESPAGESTGISSAATLGSTSLNSLAGTGQGMVIPSVTQASFRAVPDQQKPIPLASAPDRRLLEKVEGVDKPLPSVSKDGRRFPWQVYARPLTGSEQGQRLGILVTGLGFSRAATMAAITKLPGEVSLVFEPYAKDLDDWLLRARLAGHEVFVSLPMESADFPAEDPGPLALTTTVQVADNIKRLHQILGKFSGYVGVVSSMGSKFSTAEGQLKPVLLELKKRGLMFVDGGAIVRSAAPRIAAEIDLPRAKSNITLDDSPSPRDIGRKLARFEKLIKDNATAIGTIRAYPSSIKKLADWVATLKEKKLALVPVSAIANKQFIE